MIKNNNRPQRMFKIVIWGVVIFSLLMIIVGGADVIFGLKLGFSSKDIVMALVVLISAVVVNAVGTRIFDNFG